MKGAKLNETEEKLKNVQSELENANAKVIELENKGFNFFKFISMFNFFISKF